MTATHDRAADPALDAAMATVLAAERQARAAVEACAREAESLDAEARASEKAIAERAARRANAVRAGMAVKLAAELRRLEAKAREAGAADAPTDADRRRLAAAVERLGAELTGTTP